jgi:hypothetical protein
VERFIQIPVGQTFLSSLVSPFSSWCWRSGDRSCPVPGIFRGCIFAVKNGIKNDCRWNYIKEKKQPTITHLIWLGVSEAEIDDDELRYTSTLVLLRLASLRQFQRRVFTGRQILRFQGRVNEDILNIQASQRWNSIKVDVEVWQRSGRSQAKSPCKAPRLQGFNTTVHLSPSSRAVPSVHMTRRYLSTAFWKYQAENEPPFDV